MNNANAKNYGACPFQQVIPIPSRGPLLGDARPTVQLNPIPCLGQKCAAFYQEICFAGGGNGFALTERDADGNPLGASR